MRNLIGLLFAVTVCGIFSQAVFADPGAVVLKKGDRIVFLGDSITAGGNMGKGYIQVIRQHLAEKKKDVASLPALAVKAGTFTDTLPARSMVTYRFERSAK